MPGVSEPGGGGDHGELSGPRWAASGLALTAGFLDAHVYQHVAECSSPT